MELGSFLGKLKGESKTEPKKFLALVLTDEVVQASVWSVIAQSTEILAIGSPVEWDGDTGTTSELVTAVDATISSATEGLEDEPSEVILGVPHSWTDKNGILGVKREFISKIRKELELQAIGYVVITDSVLSYLKMQEGTPTTSILVQVSRDELILVLVRLGRIEAIETIGRSDDVVTDVTEGIARFKSVDNLPSRIILFNSMHDLEDIIQNLLTVNWQTDFNFLHMPKIEALAKDVAIRALSVAGGSEVAKSLGIALSPIPSVKTVSEPEGSDTKDETEEPELLSADEIGFTQKPTKMDFVDPEDAPVEPKPMKLTVPKIKLPKISLPSFKFNLSGMKKHYWIALGGLFVLGFLSFYLVWLMPKAVVNIAVVPKSLDQDVEITLSTTDSDINFAKHIVPASIETVSESGENMMETTGKKTVGDPAGGEITIYNRTSTVKNLSKDDSISYVNLNLRLTLRPW
jgi:hypothetical protein